VTKEVVVAVPSAEEDEKPQCFVYEFIYQRFRRYVNYAASNVDDK
jgi:hypothetical protein